MARIGNYRATAAQAAIAEEFLTTAVALAQQLSELGIRATQNIHNLPHENEDGETIVNGANLAMRTIADTCLSAMDALTYPPVLWDERGRRYYVELRQRARGRDGDELARILENAKP